MVRLTHTVMMRRGFELDGVGYIVNDGGGLVIDKTFNSASAHAYIHTHKSVVGFEYTLLCMSISNFSTNYS